MNEFNVLLNGATNGTPSGSLFDALFARYIAPQDSWRELKSPLPITILAAGEDLIDYRIFGNTENGESVGEPTENLFDKNNPPLYPLGYYLNAQGVATKSTANPDWYITDYIKVEELTTYYLINISKRDSYGCYTCFYDSNKNFIGSEETRNRISKTVTTPSGCAYMSVSRLDYLQTMIIMGDEIPDDYIPYGYKLPMVVTNGTATTTTPIYIGSDPLAEDEYVDFGEQKVYKRTENLFNKDFYSKEDFEHIGNAAITLLTGLKPNTMYTMNKFKRSFLNSTVWFGGLANYDTIINVGALTRQTNSDGKIIFGVRWNEFEQSMQNDEIMLVEGSTAPDQYVPYFEPTDPPAPIPALPTIKGETIIDYNPSTTPAVEPEKMYIKYKPQ